MRREFLINLIFLILLNLLVKPLYLFGVDLQVQKQLGEVYGLYFALFNLSFLFQIFSDWGIQIFSNQFLAPHPKLGDKYFPKLFWIKLGLSVLVLPLGLGAAWLLGYRGSELPGVLGLLLSQVLITFIGFLRANISTRQAYRVDSVFSALDKILMLVFGAILVYGGGLSLQTFIYAQTLAYALTALPALWFLHGRLPKGWYRVKISGAFLHWLFRQTGPFALIILLMSLYGRLDAVLLGQWASKEEANTYAFAYRILDALNMLGYLLAGLLLPMFGRLLSNRQALAELFNLALRLVLPAGFGAACLVFLHADALTELLLGLPSPYKAEVLRWLLLCFVPMSAIYVFGPLLTTGGQIRQMNWAFVGAIVFNFVGNAWAIPTYGAWGAALIALLTQTWILLAEAYLVWRHYGLPAWSGLRPVLGFIPGFGLVAWALAAYSPWPWWGQFGLAALFALPWAWLTGVLPRRLPKSLFGNVERDKKGGNLRAR